MKKRPEDLLRIYAAAPTGLCIFDTDLRYLHISESLAKMNGLSVEAHLGRSIFEVIPAVAAGVADQLRHVIETGQPTTEGTVVAETLADPGVKKCFQHSYYPARSDGGAIVGVGCVVADITTLYESQEALQANEEVLATAQQLAQFGSWSWNVATGEIAASAELLRIRGREPGQNRYHYDAFLDAVHPDDRAFVQKSVDDALGLRTPYDIEYRIVRPDGTVRFVNARGKFDTRNESLRMLGTSLDITERRRIRKALRQSEALHRVVLENTVDGVVTINEKGTIQTFNRAAELIFGYTAAEAVGQNVKILVPEPEHGAHDQYIANYLLTGNAKIIGVGREVIGRRKDGTPVDLRLGIGEVNLADGRYFIATMQDLTERNRYEKRLRQAQKLEAIGKLAGGIAHDFNNILLPIITITEICREELPPNGDLADHLATVLKAAQRGQALIDQILKFSRRLPVAHSFVDLGTVVLEALGLFVTTLPPEIEIRSRITADVPEIPADPNRIYEVVMNLLANAAQAIGDDRGVIDISWQVTDIDESGSKLHSGLTVGPYAHLVVADTGCGMDDATRLQMFDPFFTTKPLGGGTGLGLAAVHGIVADHGGQIEVSSAPGQGTRFEIYLPIAVQVGAPAATAGALDDEGEKPEGGLAGHRVATEAPAPRILVVDDDPLVLLALVRLLEREGYQVLKAADGPTALSIQQEHRADLIVTDIMMPGMDGLEMVRRLREEGARIPVIAISGGSHIGSLDELLQSGEIKADKAFTKPIDMAAFLKAVSRLLKRG